MGGERLRGGPPGVGAEEAVAAPPATGGAGSGGTVALWWRRPGGGRATTPDRQRFNCIIARQRSIAAVSDTFISSRYGREIHASSVRGQLCGRTPRATTDRPASPKSRWPGAAQLHRAPSAARLQPPWPLALSRPPKSWSPACSRRPAAGLAASGWLRPSLLLLLLSRPRSFASSPSACPGRASWLLRRDTNRWSSPLPLPRLTGR